MNDPQVLHLASVPDTCLLLKLRILSATFRAAANAPHCCLYTPQICSIFSGWSAAVLGLGCHASCVGPKLRVVCDVHDRLDKTKDVRPVK